MSGIQTVVAFMIALGVLVVVHELGHYAVARACGVKVIRFSIGFGRVVWSRRFGPDQTEWALSLVPLGGYVSMLDEREGANQVPIAPADLPRAFNRQPVQKRIAIVLAGPIANLILAVLLYTGLNIAGVDEPVARISEPTADSPAAKARMRAGDRIVKVNDESVASWVDFRWQMLKIALDSREARITFTAPDGTQREAMFDFANLPRVDPDSDFLGALGITLNRPMLVLGRIEPRGAGDRAGLRAGDIALAVDGVRIDTAARFVDLVRKSGGRPLNIDVRRADETVRIVARADVRETRGEDGRSSSVGRLGVAIGGKLETTNVRYGPIDALTNAASHTWDMSAFSIKMLGKMLVGDLSIKHLSGPVTIADYAGQSARLGLDAYISFIALISISLGVLNLLPVPMLDGGHLLYYLAELARGKPLPDRVLATGQRIGLALLVTLMAVALFNDFTRLFT